MLFPTHPKLAILATLTYCAMTYCTIAQPVLAQNITPAQDGIGTEVLTQGNRTDITGGTRSINGGNLFHSFQNFNLGTGEIANFVANPTTQNILGRVIGGQPSLIDGQISVTGSNANLFLLNPAGMVFGANASLNVPASFTASTASQVQFGNQLWDAATTANQLQNLTGSPTGFAIAESTLSNAGGLAVNPGKSLTLLGGNVINTGTFKTEGGNITIAAIANNKFVRISPTGSILGVEIPLAALQTENQKSETPTSPIPAVSQTENQKSGDITLSGTLSTATKDQTSGNIDIFGDRITVQNATIDTSSPETAGKIRIGGDYQGQGTAPRSQTTAIDRASTLLAEGKTGGQIIIWSDGATRVQGKLSAKGVTQGGLIETSGKQHLDITGIDVNASALQGNAGTWLLDPSDINIITGGSGAIASGLFDPPGPVSTIDPTTISNAMNAGSNVTITTSSGTGGNGDITLTNSINQTVANGTSLTLTGRRIINNGGQINLASTGGLTFNLNQINPEAIATTTSIQGAVDAIGNVTGPRTINLGAGTYQGAQLNINRNVNIIGQSPQQTILNGENLRRVVFTSGNVPITLQNLTIRNGNLPAGAGNNGAGILNSARLTLNQVTVTNNFTPETGGGIQNTSNGILTLNNSQITQNTVTKDGAGLFNVGTLFGTDSTFSGNAATNGQGGGLFNRGNATLTNTNFLNNRASADGGGIRNGAVGAVANLTIRNSEISGNRTGAGGGIEASYDGRVILDNVRIINNRATGGGGIQNDDNVVMSITNSTIENNLAVQGAGILNYGILDVNNSAIVNNRNNDPTLPSNQGAGIFNTIRPNPRTGAPTPSLGQLTTTNVTLSGNRSNTGGALYADRGTINLRSTTIANNTATTNAGGIQNNTAQVTVQNTLIAQNNAPTNTNLSGAFSDLGNNLIDIVDGGSGFNPSPLIGTGSQPIEALIAPLANYGGPTMTQALLPGSLALNAGNTAAAPASDQRGIARVSNADIGAFESRGFTLTTTGGSNQTTPINTAFPQPLTVTVTAQGNEPVNGGQITFTSPTTGASTTILSTPITIAGGTASLPVQANAIDGTYSITATTSGIAAPESFTLTNTTSPTTPPVIPPTTPPVIPPTTPPTTPPAATPPSNTTLAQQPNPPQCFLESIEDYKDEATTKQRRFKGRLAQPSDRNTVTIAIDQPYAQYKPIPQHLNPQVINLGCTDVQFSEPILEKEKQIVTTQP